MRFIELLKSVNEENGLIRTEPTVQDINVQNDTQTDPGAIDPEHDIELVPQNDEAEKEKKEKESEKKKESFSKARIIREKLIEKFNEDNDDSTRIRIATFETKKNKDRLIKVVMDIDPEEIYLDKNKYKDGEASIILNDIFYNDLLATGKEFGIIDIKWKKKGDMKVGIIILSPELK